MVICAENIPSDYGHIPSDYGHIPSDYGHIPSDYGHCRSAADPSLQSATHTGELC